MQYAKKLAKDRTKSHNIGKKIFLTCEFSYRLSSSEREIAFFESPKIHHQISDNQLNGERNGSSQYNLADNKRHCKLH